MTAQPHGSNGRIWHSGLRCWLSATHLVSEKSYEHDASTKSALNQLDSGSRMRGTLSFFPWPGNGIFCRNACVRWGLVGPFLAVQNCEYKLNFYCRLLRLYAARVSGCKKVSCHMSAVISCFMNFASCCESFTFIHHLVHSSTMIIRPVALKLLLVFRLLWSDKRLLVRLSGYVDHKTNYFFDRYFHRFGGYARAAFNHWVVSSWTTICCL